MDLYFTAFPNSSAGIPCTKNHRLLSETVSNNKTTISTEVVHAGTASNTHINVAKINMEINLCSITVSPSTPKISIGKHHNTRDTTMAIASFTNRDTLLFSAKRLAFFKF